jgi:AcrR family transcriptional regulator
MMSRPRDEDRIDIPARAVEVGIRLFSERGVEQVSMREIAAEVGCRAPALYRYFASKEALLLAVHNEGFRRLYAYKLKSAEPPATTPFERLRQGGLAYVQFAIENPQLYELMFNEPGPHRYLETLRAQGAEDVEDFAMRSLAFLKQSIELCQNDGFLTELDPERGAFTFWSTVHGAVSLAIRGRVPFATDDISVMAAQAVETMMALTRATERRSSSD